MWTWLNESPAGQAVFSYVKVFLAVVLGLFLADGADVTQVDASDLKTWLAAGIAAVLPVIISALNPNDSRYGVGVVEDFEEPFVEEEYVGE